MIGFFRVLGRVLGWLLRTRVLRPVLAFAIFVWLLDGVVTTATDATWFSSVGLSRLWSEQFAWAGSIGAVFVVLGLAAGVPLMRAVARPVGNSVEEPALPRALARWQTLRGRAPRLGWLCIALVALFLGRGLSLRWNEFAMALTASPTQGGEVADFWMMRAPALQSSLAAAWAFTLALGLVVLGAGLLRALPFLAARPSITPVRWLRALWGVGILLCVLRALGFAFEALRHAQVANDSNAARVGFVLLNALGAMGCLLVMARLRRPRPTLMLGVMAVLVLPSLGGDLLSPFVGRSSLAPPSPDPVEISSRNPDDWPQWDEATLLRAARLYWRWDNKERIVVWQRAGISLRRDGRGSRADIAGAPVITDEWAGHGMADGVGEIAWQSLELPEQRATAGEGPLGPRFYGLSARPLLSTEAREVGVPFQRWLWKLSWAWRLRDPLLLIEGARSRRLLVVRGVREVGQKLVPFWTWDEAVPRRDSRTGDAYFECVAYASSPYWPRRATFESGVFAGQNMVTPVAVLRLDARSGEVHLAPFVGSDSVIAHWKAALPSLFGSNAGEVAPTHALQVALANGASLVWVRTSGGWEKKALPLNLRGALQRKLDKFAQTARQHSQNHLDGATPMMWRQGEKLYLAQAFFDLAVSNGGRLEVESEMLPRVKGVAAGPLDEDGHQTEWSTSFVGARAALNSSATSRTSDAGMATPSGRALRPARDLTQEAREAGRAAIEALKQGRYVDAQKQWELADDLLQELGRRTP